ncbi:PspC domain-containing protein [Propionimicrobium sp. BV2F7]|uniref:PspC domain-containing protein n=1 Tax=Propionimicrobium sp. BV2F7 TaxID=1111131 RepID=UPI0003D79A4B|nr:PspC domain-containing protein [Propionimicrobium sp. BV2F7]ETJ97470.1 PspC domain protein [Propionimicrobium sp. BV2F7]
MSQQKQLVRSKDNRMLAGVCSGIADYTGFDLNIIRLVVVVLSIVSSGIGIGAYVVGYLLIPEEGSDKSVLDGMLNKNDGPRDSFRSE